jgi:hypothetical protein
MNLKGKIKCHPLPETPREPSSALMEEDTINQPITQRLMNQNRLDEKIKTLMSTQGNKDIDDDRVSE